MKEGREDKRLQINRIKKDGKTVRRVGSITLGHIFPDASVPNVSNIRHWGLLRLKKTQ